MGSRDDPPRMRRHDEEFKSRDERRASGSSRYREDDRTERTRGEKPARERRRSRSRTRSPDARNEGSSTSKCKARDRDERERHHRDRSRSRSRSRSRDRRDKRDGRDEDRRDNRRRDRSADRRRDRSGDRVPAGDKGRDRRRRRSTSSSSSSSSSDSEDERRRRRRKERKKEENQKKKDRKRDKASAVYVVLRAEFHDVQAKATAASTGKWGKYGIISETDIVKMDSEFRAWLVEERKLNPENIPKDRTRKEFSVFVEDYNTATLPHDKYYNMAKYDIRMNMIRSGTSLPLDVGSYDPLADMRAHTSLIKAADPKKRKELSREELLELRRVEAERIEIGKRRLLGIDVPKNMGVRTEEINVLFDE